jgi:DNA-binding transcriptional LysR family regulator
VATDYQAGPSEWELRVFIAVAETHGAQAAAEELRRMRGVSYGRQSVKTTLDKLDAWVGEPLLARQPDRKLYPTDRGQQFYDQARAIVAQYEAMRGKEQSLPVLACMPHHAHFVSQAEDLLYGTPPDGQEKLLVKYLPEHERGESEFNQHAVSMLRTNAYQLIIGPRVEGATFESTTLYCSQLEAMVSRDHEADEISLTDLVRNHRMLVSPRDMRSRTLLENRIRDWSIDDPGPAVRVAAETYETATSVLRLRNEFRRRGRADSRVIVVPSDVALVYKHGMEFGGLYADRFKWVPIYHSDGAGTAHLLRLEVCVTVRTVQRHRLREIVRTLKQAVEMLNESTAHDGLCGAPFRGRRPALIPSQPDRVGRGGSPGTRSGDARPRLTS